MIILLKLLLAHILGDFILQPNSWAKDKRKNKIKSPKLYFHILVHLIITTLLLWDLKLWPIIVFIICLHFLIDVLKIYMLNKENEVFLFFIDQALHLLVIFAALHLFTDLPLIKTEFKIEEILLFIICLLFLTKPVSVIMSNLLLKDIMDDLKTEHKSIKYAGHYIGVLERTLVFLFMICGQWEAVGFLITAKSVFSFGNLSASKDRRLTEYILIGTLISFGIAIITSLLYLNLINYV
ncbi:DUF3307 domain-containing protein [Winogradskyella psychrotolerans]|uniref:DUF3307 domain-containing protein n=1 Tax=Winogradskyella psychrotolerans TaxID=1344585 RepID=UPI001C07408E|nr:DUF3307 domain-containing protein [Winogradskyella psychrotolerans]MBU2920767.1 DUF3307 domain-containing protein [Winogradskyella psychrotolerans]